MMPDFTKRSYSKELLDRTDIPFADIRQNMIELDIINSKLGGHAISIQGLKQLLASKGFVDRVLHIVEIGCGGGDNLRVLKDWLERNNYKARFTGLDINKECIAFAQERNQNEGIQFLHADYKAVPFHVKPDVIFASLFCHHFTDEELVSMMRWTHDNSAIGFFINDLHRHPLAYYSIGLFTRAFSKSYLVKNDAPLSVLRGFVKRDWQRIFGAANLGTFNIQWKWAFRWLITCFHHDR
jgi:SAM-dependent methyltransferase